MARIDASPDIVIAGPPSPAGASYLDMALLDRIRPVAGPPGGPSLRAPRGHAVVYVQVNARGWQRRPDLRKEFSDVIFALEKGQHSTPLIMPEGAFILFVEDRKHAGTLPLDEARPDIERTLVQQGSRQATERWLEKLRRNAYVKHF